MNQKPYVWGIFLSFLLAFALTILPFSEEINALRPEWVTLVFIYWCLLLPKQIGIWVGWVVGFFLDVLQNTPFGQHALFLSLAAYFLLKFRQKFRNFPHWQQLAEVFTLLMLQQCLAFVVTYLRGYGAPEKTSWLSPVIGTLFWLLLANLLDRFYQQKDATS